MNKKARAKAPPLLDRISFLIHRINAHLMRHMNPRLKEWGIDLTESRLLVALLDLGPLPAGEVVRVMALPQSTVSHQMKRLEKRGYVKRAPHDSDSRVVIASLTEAGREIALQAEECSRTVTAQFGEAIGSSTELEAVRAAMKRIDKALMPPA